MPTDDTQAPPDATRLSSPLRRLLTIGAPVLLILLAIYWFALRTRYEPILIGVAPDEAAEIVKVLDARKIDYRLSDEGRTILVASGAADRARLDLVGSELPIRGQVGFELFNQSDMGLTEFAQKINYQRALQGELARTILLLRDIQSVRVHLGLPERSVFRDDQARPKASVTLILKPGTNLTESRVAGIQRMVAGAIPEMTPDAVAVLDGTGRVVSRDLPVPPTAFGNSDAIIESYRRRIAAAIGRLDPALRYAANVSLRLRPATPGVNQAPERDGSTAAAPRGDPDYAVNVRITTPEALDDTQRLELIRAIQDGAGIERVRGDAIVFLIGDPGPPQSEPEVHPNGDRVVAATADHPATHPAGLFGAAWLVALALVTATFAGVVFWRERRRRWSDNRDALTSFAEQLRRRLVPLEDAS